MIENKINPNDEVIPKKRGRKPKNYKKVFELNRDQTKFFIDLSKEKSNLEMVFNLIEKANKKDIGKEITFKDISIYAISKLNSKDIEKIQDNSLTKQERLEQAWKEFNEKNKQNLTFDDFLLKKVGIL